MSSPFRARASARSRRAPLRHLWGGLLFAALPATFLLLRVPALRHLVSPGSSAQAALVDRAPEAEAGGPVTQAEMHRLSADLHALLRGAPARRAAVFVQDIPTGLTAQVNGDRRFVAASLIKLQVLAAVYRLWERQPALKTLQRRDLVERMITESDNWCTDRLIDMVGGPEVVTGFCAARGWRDLQVRHAILNHRGRVGRNECTAREITALLVALDRRELVDRSADDEMWAVLCRQKHRKRIPGGVPRLPGVTVGNKTGTLGSVLHDAGIVQTPRTHYALCILLSGQHGDARAEKFCRRLSRLVFDRLNGPPAVPTSIASAAPTEDSAPVSTVARN